MRLAGRQPLEKEAAAAVPCLLVAADTVLPGEAGVGALGLEAGRTGIAQLLLFRILRDHGAARTSLVTYLMPPIALVYGALLLGEPLTAEEVIGMALILLGIGLGSGLLRLPRRVPATQTP